MVQAGAECCDRQLAALVWLPGRGLCGGMGSSSVCPLFPSAPGLPSKVTTVTATVDSVLVTWAWPYGWQSWLLCS